MRSGSVAARLRAARKRVGKSNAQIARELGKDKAQVVAWMNGKRRPSAENARLLAEYFGEAEDAFVTPLTRASRVDRLEKMSQELEALRRRVRRLERDHQEGA